MAYLGYYKEFPYIYLSHKDAQCTISKMHFRKDELLIDVCVDIKDLSIYSDARLRGELENASPQVKLFKRSINFMKNLLVSFLFTFSNVELSFE